MHTHYSPNIQVEYVLSLLVPLMMVVGKQLIVQTLIPWKRILLLDTAALLAASSTLQAQQIAYVQQ